jgi:hypothetical protein
MWTKAFDIKRVGAGQPEDLPEERRAFTGSQVARVKH